MKSKFGPAAVGAKAAKDFAEDGIFFGEVSKCDNEPDEDGDDADGGIRNLCRIVVHGWRGHGGGPVHLGYGASPLPLRLSELPCAA